MSTVYYLRYNICEHCDRYDETRICRFSAGNPIIIYGLKNYYIDENTRINITSYEDLKNIISSKKFELYDEYERKINPTQFYDNFDYFNQREGMKVIFESEIIL